jgi:hypothetical protein
MHCASLTAAPVARATQLTLRVRNPTPQVTEHAE